MLVRVPDYFDDFSCLAGACPHSCCIGWEVVIDEDTARKIIAEVAKNNDKVPTNYEFDSTVADNLKVVNGKITVALKVAAA